MALQNPSNLYSGGQGVFDSRPVLMFKANLMAKEKAKKDALDDYYGKALQDVTPAGMRNKDVIGGWSQKLNEFKDFGLNPENKKYLLNPSLDGHKTATEFNRRHTELLTEAEKSKNELKDENMLNDLRISGKWNPDDDDVEIAHKKGLSIYDPARLDGMGRDVDMTNLSFNVPEFDGKKQESFRKAILGAEKAGKSYDESKATKDNNTGQVFIPYVESYSPDTIKKAAENAEKLVSSDKAARKYYNGLLHNDDAFLEKANAALKSLEGENAIVDTPAKAAKADWIMRLAGETKRGEDVKSDWVFNKQITFNNARTMEGIRHRNAMERLRSGLSLREAYKDLNEQEIAQSVDLYVQDQEDNAKELPKSEMEKIANQYGFTVDKFSKELPISTLDREAFSKRNESTGKLYYPKRIFSSPDGKTMKIVGDGFDEEISRTQYRTTLASKAINTKYKAAQITKKPAPLKTKSGSSASKSTQIKGVKITPNKTGGKSIFD